MFKKQALLIYELSNKNHLKSINDQNFANFMRDYDKGFYDIDLLLFLWIIKALKLRRI